MWKRVYKLANWLVASPTVTLVEALSNRWGVGVRVRAEACYTSLKCGVPGAGHRYLVIGAVGQLVGEGAAVHRASPAILLVPARPGCYTGGLLAKDERLIRLPCVVRGAGWWCCRANMLAWRVHVWAASLPAHTELADVVAWLCSALVHTRIRRKIGHVDVFGRGWSVLWWRLKMRSRLSWNIVAELAVVAESTEPIF
jgi:hypothetical protein